MDETSHGNVLQYKIYVTIKVKRFPIFFLTIVYYFGGKEYYMTINLLNLDWGVGGGRNMVMSFL